MRNQQLRAIIYRFTAEHRYCQQCQTKLEIEYYQLYINYFSTQQTLQISKQSRANFEKRVEAQLQTLSNFVRLFQILCLYIAENQLSEKDRNIDVDALLLENEHLQQKLDNLRYFLINNIERLEQAQKDIIFSKKV